MTDGKQQHCEHTLEWIAAGLVAFFIFAGVVFYSFSVDVRSVGVSTHQRLTRSSIANLGRVRHLRLLRPGAATRPAVFCKCYSSIVHEDRFATDETLMESAGYLPPDTWAELEDRLLDIVRSRSS